MGQTGDQRFLADDANELRNLERRIRSTIDKLAAKMALSSLHHTVWEAAVKELSAGDYRLMREPFTDFDQAMRRIEEVTGIHSAGELDPAVTTIVLKRPVLTSFTSIGSQQYRSGHIAAVLGTDGAQHTMPGLALLNSAVALSGGDKLSCQLDDLPGDTKYKGVASVEPSYAVKTFAGKYILMWIQRN